MRVKTVGLTGGIGSGKSTVARMFEALGAHVFYADDVARRIMEEDPEVRQAIIELLGPESYLPDGKLNRRYIAERVFKDERLLKRLNRIVHPRVHRAFQHAREALARQGGGLLIEEAALIFETGAVRFLDKVIVVDAPEEERVRRVVKRDNVSPEHVRARMRHQLPSKELRARADYVIENTGSLEDLRRKVEHIYRELVADP